MLTFNAVQPRILLIISLILNVGARRVEEALLHTVERNSKAPGSEKEAGVESSLPANTHSHIIQHGAKGRQLPLLLAAHLHLFAQVEGLDGIPCLIALLLRLVVALLGLRKHLRSEAHLRRPRLLLGTSHRGTSSPRACLLVGTVPAAKPARKAASHSPHTNLQCLFERPLVLLLAPKVRPLGPRKTGVPSWVAGNERGVCTGGRASGPLS